MSDKAALHLDDRWDRLLDLSLRRLCYGTFSGGLAALLLFSELPIGALRLHDMPACMELSTAAWSRATQQDWTLIKRCCRLAGGPHLRTAAVAFGAGAGIGSAWQLCNKEVK